MDESKNSDASRDDPRDKRATIVPPLFRQQRHEKTSGGRTIANAAYIKNTLATRPKTQPRGRTPPLLSEINTSERDRLCRTADNLVNINFLDRAALSPGIPPR
jgi:hypothetical protein